MVVDVERLVLQISSDLSKLQKNNATAVANTNKSLKAIEDRFDKMDATVSRSAADMGNSVKTAIAGIGLGVAIRQLEDYANGWINLRNTARQYQDVIGPVDQSTNRLVKTANDAGVAVSDLSFLMGAGSRAARTLGRSGDDVFAFLEAVSKGAAIANTGTAAVQGAMVQLSQSIGSPKAQLQEFNSIVEGTPRLAQAFADGVKEAGGSIATLRQLIADGKVSGADLFQGLLSQLPKLRAEFATAEVSIGRALTVLRNAALQYVGTLDQATGASATMAGLIKHVADNLDLFAAAAFAAVAVFGGRGAIGAIGAVTERLKASQAAFDAERVSIEKRVVAARAESVAAAQAASNLRDEIQLRAVMVEQLRAQVEAAPAAMLAYKAEQAALIELENAQKALLAANALAGQSNGSLMSSQTAVALASHRLQEAEANLALIRQKAPGVLKDYTRAVAGWNAAQDAAVVGSKRLIAAQTEQVVAQKAASEASVLFKSAMAGLSSFLAGPLGTVALIAALTFGMQVFSKTAKTTEDRLNDLRGSMDRLKETRDEITADTTKLKAENEKLTKAIEAQQPAAEDTARVEIEAINRRIAKNRELAKTYEANIRAQLAAAEKSEREENAADKAVAVGLSFQVPVGNPSITGAGNDVLLKAAIDETKRLQDAGVQLSAAQAHLLEIAARIAARSQDVNRLREALNDLGKPVTPETTDPAGLSGASVSKLKQYSTALNEFKKTLAEIRASKEDDAAKSRAAVQAVLDYASAGKSVAAAWAEIPSLSDVLLGPDAETLRGQLHNQVEDARVAGLEGLEKLEQDHQRALDALDKQEKDAQAVGLDDQAEYYARRLDLDRDYMEKRGKIIDDMVDLDPNDVFPSLATFDEDQDRFTHDLERRLDLTAGDEERARRARLLGAREYTDEILKQSAILQKSKELENAGFSQDDAKGIAEDLIGQVYAVRDGMRSAVKDGLKEGLETDDWGKAVRDILANALTSALDKSLDRFADFLTNLVLGDGSSGNKGLISAAIGYFTGGNQPRAAGGPRSPMSLGKVNETGKGEFLFMGNNPGQVLTAAQVNGLVTGGARGGVSISSPLIVQGSLTEEVLPKVQKMMAENNQKLMQVVPHMIDGRTIENARYRRYGGKR